MKRNHHNTNENLKQLSKETLIIGVDIAKRVHVARAVDYRGMELSRTLSFPSGIKGFLEFHSHIREQCVMHKKTEVVVGLEPTGPYGNTLIQFLRAQNVKVVLVLGMQVSRAKELDDNTPSKNDYKDALTIAGLVRDGRFRQLREFNDNIYELKEAMSCHRQTSKKLVALKCQVDNWLCQYFPEFSLAFKDWTKKTAYATLKNFPLPSEMNKLSAEEMVTRWRAEGVIKGVGMKKAEQLKRYARNSVGVKSGREFSGLHIRNLLAQYDLLLLQQEELWLLIDVLLRDIPLYDALMNIPYIGQKAVCGIIAEIGDPTDFSHPKQLTRLAGLSLKESSSGGRRGTSEITKRGRPHLRHWLYLAVLNLLKEKEPSFWALHQHYITRRENPLKKMQSVIALCNKLLRVIFGMAVKGSPYDPNLVTSGLPALRAA